MCLLFCLHWVFFSKYSIIISTSNCALCNMKVFILINALNLKSDYYLIPVIVILLHNFDNFMFRHCQTKNNKYVYDRMTCNL